MQAIASVVALLVGIWLCLQFWGWLASIGFWLSVLVILGIQAGLMLLPVVVAMLTPGRKAR